MGPPPFGDGNKIAVGVMRSLVSVYLQWGHRLSAMETHRPGTPAHHGYIPSMGPPPFGDGNHSCRNNQRTWTLVTFNGATAFRRWKRYRIDVIVHRVHVPSMGPPPFGDGNDCEHIRLAKRYKDLQWGHRLSAMETMCCELRIRSVPILQWGHRLSAMETDGGHKERLEVSLPSMGPPPFGDGN